MDSDLQDRPEEIPKLYEKAQNRFDIVFARRERQDSWHKRRTSAEFSAVFRYFTKLNYYGAVGNFRIISRQVADSFREFGE